MKFIQRILVLFLLLGLSACSYSQQSGEFYAENSQIWPQSLPSELPVFGYAKILEEGGIITNDSNQWTMTFVEVSENALNRYQQDLKDNGWNEPDRYQEKGYDYIVTEWSDYYLNVYAPLDDDGVRLELKKL
jgi:hypothetical protein